MCDVWLYVMLCQRLAPGGRDCLTISCLAVIKVRNNKMLCVRVCVCKGFFMICCPSTTCSHKLDLILFYLMRLLPIQAMRGICAVFTLTFLFRKTFICSKDILSIRLDRLVSVPIPEINGRHERVFYASIQNFQSKPKFEPAIPLSIHHDMRCAFY